MLTQERLKELLHYDPDTGVFTWRHRIMTRNRPSKKGGREAGCKNTFGYLTISIDWKSYYCHRLAWLYEYGYFPENEIDHINRVKSDNRIINLRESSHICNSRNCKISKNNTTGIVGVHYNKKSNTWYAQIKTNYKNNNLGIFDTKIEAVIARWEAEIKFGFKNCYIDSTAYQYLKRKEVRHPLI